MQVVLKSNYGKQNEGLEREGIKTGRSKVSLNVTSAADLHLAAKERTPCCYYLKPGVHDCPLHSSMRSKYGSVTVTSEFPVYSVKQCNLVQDVTI